MSGLIVGVFEVALFSLAVALCFGPEFMEANRRINRDVEFLRKLPKGDNK